MINIRKYCVAVSVVLLTLMISFSYAQNVSTESRIEQSRRFDIDPTFQPTEDDGIIYSEDGSVKAPETPGDSDLGVQAILSRKEESKEFSIFANVAGYYTSNAFLTRKDPIDDRFMAADVGASYSPQFTERFSGDITFKQQFFRYDDNDVLDFDGQNVSAGLMYVIEDFWDTAAFARGTYTRLTRANDYVDGPSGSEFYKNTSLLLGLQKTYQFSKAHYIFGGVSYELGFTQWQENNIVNPQRDEYALFVGYQASITRYLSSLCFYRMALLDYDKQAGRQDLNQIVSLGLTYKIADWVNLQGTGSWTFNNSNRPAVGDYESRSAGASLSLTYRF